MAGCGQPMTQRILRIYIDDSGEKEYGEKTSRFFVYAGVIVDRADEAAITAEVDRLKQSAFGTTDVEIKSNWLRFPPERQRRYLDRFKISEARLRQFVDELRQFMTSDRFTYLAAAIDKPAMQDRYPTPWYPSATAYHFLLQRYEKHCADAGASGLITIDDMDGSSPKNNEWRDLLRAQHTRLKKDGCPLTKMTFPNMPKAPLFASSARFNLLQLADLLAYNVFRQFREHGDAWDKGEAMPIYKHLDPLLRRFRIGPDGVIEGWGIIKWPHDRTGRWLVD
jgi:hypothetical protein